MAMVIWSGYSNNKPDMMRAVWNGNSYSPKVVFEVKDTPDAMGEERWSKIDPYTDDAEYIIAKIAAKLGDILKAEAAAAAKVKDVV